MPTPIVETHQSEDGYPIDAELLTALALESGQGQGGLIYDKVFKPINTGGLCEVMGFDFKQTFDTAGVETHEGVLDYEQGFDNEMTCDSEAKELQAPKWSRRAFEVKWHANKVNLNSCCLNVCGMTKTDYETLVKDTKIGTLVRNFHQKREIAGRDLLIGKTLGAWNAGWTDALGADLLDCATQTDVEGVAFDLGGAKMCDKDYDLQTLFQNAQSEDMTCSGQRNAMIINKKALWAIRRNNSLKGSGCVIPASAAIDLIKAEFGIEEIIIADHFTNLNAVGTAKNLTQIWDKSFIMLFQKDSGLQSIDDPRARQNFAVDLRKYEPYVRIVNKPENGENGIDFMHYHYSYTPEIHNLKAGTLFYNF